MKRFLISLFLICLVFTSYAGPESSKGRANSRYTGEISVADIHFPGGGYENRPAIFTTHGVTFSNDIFIGGGLGFDFSLYTHDGSGVQYLYAAVGHSMDHGQFGSYLKCRMGISYGQHGDDVIGLMIMPEIGVSRGKCHIGICLMGDSECKRETDFKYQWMKSALIFSISF